MVISDISYTVLKLVLVLSHYIYSSKGRTENKYVEIDNSVTLDKVVDIIWLQPSMALFPTSLRERAIMHHF